MAALARPSAARTRTALLLRHSQSFFQSPHLIHRLILILLSPPQSSISSSVFYLLSLLSPPQSSISSSVFYLLLSLLSPPQSSISSSVLTLVHNLTFLPPELAKAPSTSPSLRPPSAASKPTFASALRDLAKNAGEEVRRPGPPTPTPVVSSLQDVRKVRTPYCS